MVELNRTGSLTRCIDTSYQTKEIKELTAYLEGISCTEETEGILGEMFEKINKCSSFSENLVKDKIDAKEAKDALLLLEMHNKEGINYITKEEATRMKNQVDVFFELMENIDRSNLSGAGESLYQYFIGKQIIEKPYYQHIIDKLNKQKEGKTYFWKSLNIQTLFDAFDRNRDFNISERDAEEALTLLGLYNQDPTEVISTEEISEIERAAVLSAAKKAQAYIHFAGLKELTVNFSDSAFVFSTPSGKVKISIGAFNCAVDSNFKPAPECDAFDTHLFYNQQDLIDEILNEVHNIEVFTGEKHGFTKIDFSDLRYDKWGNENKYYASIALTKEQRTITIRLWTASLVNLIDDMETIAETIKDLFNKGTNLQIDFPAGEVEPQILAQLPNIKEFATENNFTLVSLDWENTTKTIEIVAYRGEHYAQEYFIDPRTQRIQPKAEQPKEITPKGLPPAKKGGFCLWPF